LAVVVVSTFIYCLFVCLHRRIRHLRVVGMTVDRYEYVTDLNKGSYGVVSLVRDTRDNGRLVALKCINSAEEAKQEVVSHQVLGDHKNIAQLVDHFEGRDKYYLVMEYCGGGDLYEAIRGGRSPLQQGNIKKFMNQLIDALIYSHEKGVYHRDIKPENILIGNDGSVKLADWGLSTFNRICSEFGVGSERYMAPELFDEENVEEYDAEKTDIWSVGICLLNILFGRNPFTTASQNDKLFLDFASNREALFDIFPTLSFDTFSVLRHCLTIDPDNRSLQKMKNELNKVEFWTTDEEEIDLDYEEQLDNVPDIITTTVNRQPLRTPSVMTADGDGDDPILHYQQQQEQQNNNWLRTMQFTPPTRQFHVPPEMKNPGYRKSHLNSMHSVDEEVDDDDNKTESSSSIAGDDDDDVFHMENDNDDGINNDLACSFSALNTNTATNGGSGSRSRSDDSSSIESVPSLVQSTTSSAEKTSTTNTTTTTTNPGLSASIPTPFTSLPKNKDFLKFGKSWSDLDDLNDDADDDLFNYDFLLNQKKPAFTSLSNRLVPPGAGTTRT
jgi:serine/threonine protein kinase